MSRKLLFTILVIYAIWGFVCSKTVYGSPMAVYISFSTIFILFGVFFVREPKQQIDKVSKVWMPYLVVTVLGAVINGSFEMMVYWLVALMIIRTNTSGDYYSDYPYKTLLLCGVISLIGIFVQITIPGFYYSYINSVFTDTNSLEAWFEEEYGFAGFTYQLAATAMPIIYAIPIVLYSNGRGYELIKKEWWKYLTVILLIIGVFLTGKRTLAACALLFPFLVAFLTSKTSAKKNLVFLVSVLVSTFAVSYFINHAYDFTDDVLLRRFAESIIESSSGDDITSGRSNLYDLAYRAFQSHPILGIGVGQFIPYTNAYTSVHNTYLQVLCEQGLIGIVLYVFPIIYCLIKTIQINKKENNSLLKISLFIQLIFIVYAMSGNVNSELSTFGIYFLSLGFLQNSLQKSI